MTEQSANDSPKKSCGCSFNYCLVSKLIVAIPALPIVAMIAEMPFHNPILQVFAGSGAVIATVYLAIKIDEIPALQKKIVKRKL